MNTPTPENEMTLPEQNYIERAIEGKQCGTCGITYARNPRYSETQWARSRYCSFVCAGKATSQRQKFRKGNIPKNKGKISIRKCSVCSRTNKKVCLYKKWNILLCQRHFYHFKKYGKPLWGDERTYKTPLPKREKNLSTVGLAWRKAVFERDDYTCQECGVRGVELQADHIKPFRYFPELRWVLSNGRTLCVPCHRKTPTYGRRGQKLYAVLR